MQHIKQQRQSGFTLIELLMVILLVAILAAVSLPQFVDFRTEAKNAAVQSALGTLRTSIANQYSNIALRCTGSTGAHLPPGTHPTAAQIGANDITTAGAPCTAAMIPSTTDRQFVVGGSIPENPWSGGVVKNTVTQCTGAGCASPHTVDCAGTAFGATASGWCYDGSSGKIWANSANNGGTPALEYTF